MRSRLADKCHTVIKVGEKVYWFDEASSKKYHKEICTEAKEGTVTGTVKKDGDKMVITATKVEFKKISARRRIARDAAAPGLRRRSRPSRRLGSAASCGYQ